MFWSKTFLNLNVSEGNSLYSILSNNDDDVINSNNNNNSNNNTTCSGQRMTLSIFYCLLYFFEKRILTDLRSHWLARIACPPPTEPVSTQPVPTTSQYTPSYLEFTGAAEDLNSGPCAHTASTYLSQPSPQLHNYSYNVFIFLHLRPVFLSCISSRLINSLIFVHSHLHYREQAACRSS